MAGQSRADASPPGDIPEMSRKTIEACVGMQKEFMDAVGNLTHDWQERAATEMNLASSLAAKLMNARSVPEAAAAYQDYMTRHFEMLAEDSRRLISSSQRFMDMGRGST